MDSSIEMEQRIAIYHEFCAVLVCQNEWKIIQKVLQSAHNFHDFELNLLSIECLFAMHEASGDLIVQRIDALNSKELNAMDRRRVEWFIRMTKGRYFEQTMENKMDCAAKEYEAASSANEYCLLAMFRQVNAMRKQPNKGMEAAIVWLNFRHW